MYIDSPRALALLKQSSHAEQFLLKTAEKILLISLDLFNTEGERHISSVDIANELDISPGNLYYHYKGKDEIISALVDSYIAKINAIEPSVSTSAYNSSLKGNDEKTPHILFYVYLFKCLDSMYLFRFLFQNIAEISAQYPAINSKLQRVAKFQRQHLREALSDAQRKGFLTGTDADIDLLLDLISLTLFQSLNYYQMQGDSLDNPDISYRTLMTVFFSLQPYYNDAAEAANIKQAILSKTLPL
jgi:AcrR family transcriptional regulator